MALLPARLLHGAAEACVYTGGSCGWSDRGARPSRPAIGLYGLCVWSGYTVGPPLGQIAHELGGFTAVWRWRRSRRALGAHRVSGCRLRRRRRSTRAGGQLLPRGSIRPGIGGGMAGIGIAAINGFVVLLCIDRGFGQASGAIAIALFAGPRWSGGWSPADCPTGSAARTMVIAVVLGAAGQPLIAVAPGWWAVGLGCILFGFCWTLLFPALAMLVVDAVEPSQRGAGAGGVLELLRPRLRRRRAASLGRIASQLGYGALYVTAAVLVVVLAGLGGRPPAVTALSFAPCGAITSRRTAAR